MDVDVYHILTKEIVNKLNLSTCVKFVLATVNSPYIIFPCKATINDTYVSIVFDDSKIILALVEAQHLHLNQSQCNSFHPATRYLEKNYIEIASDLNDPATEPLYIIYDIVKYITEWYSTILDCDIRIGYTP